MTNRAITDRKSVPLVAAVAGMGILLLIGNNYKTAFKSYISIQPCSQSKEQVLFAQPSIRTTLSSAAPIASHVYTKNELQDIFAEIVGEG
jgi:hypothetical protein